MLLNDVTKYGNGAVDFSIGAVGESQIICSGNLVWL